VVVEFADKFTIVVLSEVESPAGETLAEREMVPEKPSRLTSLIREVFE
jgi:hypothetical protein